MLQKLKAVLTFELLPLPELLRECAERRLSIESEGDEEKRTECLRLLRADLFRDLYKRRGISVERLGVLKASQLATDIESLEGSTFEELRQVYEERFALPLVPLVSRKDLVERLRSLSFLVLLPVGELWTECQLQGVPLNGFDLKSTEAELRAHLIHRLLLRGIAATRIRASSSCAKALVVEPDPSDAEGAAGEAGEAAGAAEAESLDPRRLPQVWERIQYMRDPVLAECICGVKKKKLDLPTRLPAEAREWSALDAALHVLTGGKYAPLLRGERPSGDGVLVSVVCPTSEVRQHFHPLLYRCFRTQTYASKELVVVDTGTKPSPWFEEYAREDPRVVYHFFDVEDLREGVSVPPGRQSWSLGLKRNIGCALARGEVIAHFDDDDLYAPDYLSWMVPQVATGLNPAPAAAKLSEWHLLDISNFTFRYLDVTSDQCGAGREWRGWLYGWGFSYVFTRSAWELAPVPDVEFAEDAGFMESLMSHAVPIRLVRLPEGRAGVVAHSIHPASTSGGEVDLENNCKKCGTPVSMPKDFVTLMPIVRQVYGGWVDYGRPQGGLGKAAKTVIPSVLGKKAPHLGIMFPAQGGMLGLPGHGGAFPGKGSGKGIKIKTGAHNPLQKIWGDQVLKKPGKGTGH